MACNIFFIIGMFVLGVIIGFIFGARIMALLVKNRTELQLNIFDVEVDFDEKKQK